MRAIALTIPTSALLKADPERDRTQNNQIPHNYPKAIALRILSLWRFLRPSLTTDFNQRFKQPNPSQQFFVTTTLGRQPKGVGFVRDLL